MSGVPRRLEDSACVYCRKPCKENGAWVCEACKSRGRKLTPEEEAMHNGTAAKADNGSTENKQYSGSRPIAKGRVGPFPKVYTVVHYDPLRLKDDESKDLMLLRTKTKENVELWGEDKKEKP